MTENQNTNDVLQVQGRMTLGYGIVPKMAMQDRRLTPEAKAIYSYFCSFAGAGSTAFPGRDKIIYDLQMGVKRYYSHFNLLKQYGYIDVKQGVDKTGQFKNNIYTLIEMIPCGQNDHTEPCSRFAYTGDAYTDNDHTIINNIKNNNLKSNIQKVSSSLVLSNTTEPAENETRHDETSSAYTTTQKTENSLPDVENQRWAEQEKELIPQEKVKVPSVLTPPYQGKGTHKDTLTHHGDDYTTYQKIIQEQIDYNGLISETHDSGLIDNIVSVMVDVMVTNSNNTIKIGNERKPFSVIQSTIMRLTRDHIELVISKYKEQPKEIFYKKAYLRSMLYNVYNELDLHFTNQMMVDYSRASNYTFAPNTDNDG